MFFFFCLCACVCVLLFVKWYKVYVEADRERLVNLYQIINAVESKLNDNDI